jgi:hypothetical protein
LWREGREGKIILSLHVIVDLNLREEGNLLLGQTEGNVPTAITASALYTGPILETGQHNVNELSEEVLHILAVKFCLGGHGVSARRDTPWSNARPRLVSLYTDIRDSLEGNTGYVKPGRVLSRGLLDVAVNGDPLELGDIVEGDGFAEEAEDVTATRTAKSTILVVG